MKLCEGDGIAAVRNKIMAKLHIKEAKEHIQLTYQMPQWMDVDGSVKPVPIHIRSNDDLDMFLLMRTDLHDLKLYVMPLPLNMSIDVEDFRVVPVIHGFALAKVVKGSVYDRDQAVQRDKSTVENTNDGIMLTQLTRETG
ncbi:unnamed protein product [Microthlaspi erraticum]|uniref:Uncharacterized protein n=1 Tax=Microthlaspi erraticum TaxID=1685480 RepID=A0A6D2IGR4_9BRAS|nr:unnamed protein product [Microthlaspi erraticum]